MSLLLTIKAIQPLPPSLHAPPTEWQQRLLGFLLGRVGLLGARQLLLDELHLCMRGTHEPLGEHSWRIIFTRAQEKMMNKTGL